MAIQKLSQLLPVDDDVASPNPYQVLGLQAGEQDLKVITAAFQSVATKVRAAKPQTDPAVWQRAAKLLNHARGVLSDPSKKASLDSQLGPQVQVADPLAGILPAADPLAGILPTADPTTRRRLPVAPGVDNTSDGKAVELPPGLFSGPAVNQDGEPIAPAESASSRSTPDIQPQEPDTTSDPAPVAAAAPIINPSPELRPTSPNLRRGRPAARRKKSLIGPLFMTLVLAALLAMTGAVYYFLVHQKGTLTITRGNGEIRISSNTPAPQSRPEPRVREPSQTSKEPAEPFDPVMGRLNNGVSPPRIPQPNFEPATSESESSPTPADQPPEIPVQVNVATDGDGMNNVPMESLPASQQPPVTSESVTAVGLQLDKLKRAIAGPDWQNMRPKAESILKLPMDGTQSKLAKTLFDIADLAVYYRGGIQRGIAAQNAGATFEVTDDLRVVVVERADEAITVQFNKKSKTYPIDEMPFTLSSKLASFAIDESPTLTVAENIFQAIAANATEGHRRLAIDNLQNMNEPVDDVQPKQIANALQDILGLSPSPEMPSPETANP